ncbi:MAG: molybdopterin molybdotransferase MoeA [Bacteroidota bacterium]
MISFPDAYQLVTQDLTDFGSEILPLETCVGRVLAEDITADRDFPPFDRVTKDGMAIQYDSWEAGQRTFPITGIAPAGAPQQSLANATDGIEVMTGAMLPKNTDTVLMYEHLTIDQGQATLQEPIKKKGQNIHRQGSDDKKGNLILEKGIVITPAEIGILATVGKAAVLVKKLPRVVVAATGDELVDVAETPLPHQIRKSNSPTLATLLALQGISCQQAHLNDDYDTLKQKVSDLIDTSDVLMFSGGVSKGKFDHLPAVFEALGITKTFHRVKQRPGKPFWYGKHQASNTHIFAFPGNPVSTFVNYHSYFLPWLRHCLGLEVKALSVTLTESFENTTDLTCFIRAQAFVEGAQLKARLITGNGSGDLASLAFANGLVRLAPEQQCAVGDEVPFLPTRSIV